MKIEHSGSYLLLERTADTEFPYLCIAARIELPRGTFAGSNDGAGARKICVFSPE